MSTVLVDKEDNTGSSTTWQAPEPPRPQRHPLRGYPARRSGEKGELRSTLEKAPLPAHRERGWGEGQRWRGGLGMRARTKSEGAYRTNGDSTSPARPAMSTSSGSETLKRQSSPRLARAITAVAR